MGTKRFPPVVAWLLVSIGFALSLSAQDSDEEGFNFTLEIIQSSFEGKKAALFESYAGAVERLGANFQDQGDLTNVLKARAEAETARQSARFGSDEFPGIAKLREILQAELLKIEAAETERIDRAKREYAARLKNRVVEQTKAGNLEEALRLETIRKTLEAELETQNAEALASDPEPGAVSTPGPMKEPSGRLEQGEVLFGEVTLSGGSHRLRDELQIGRRQDNTDDEKGFLTVKDRAEVSGGGIWTNFGAMVAENSRFEDVELKEELQGSFRASRTLFEDCTFSKKGGWQVAWFGTRWRFSECVFHDSFFPQWTNSQVGLKITNCTFIDVDFPSFQMNNKDRDAIWQSRHEWRTIEKCRFIECEIPISVLLATEDCVFEECKFVEDEFPQTREMLSSLTDALKVTVYYAGIAAPEIASPSPKLEFEVKRATSVQENWGCPPFYTFVANELQFR